MPATTRFGGHVVHALMALAAASSSKEPKFVDAEVVQPPIDYSTTKSDDVELWAIRVPPGFDASRLDGLTLDTAGGARGDGFTVRAAPTCDPRLVVSAFPSTKKNRWVVGKPFTRQLAVIMDPPELPAPVISAHTWPDPRIAGTAWPELELVKPRPEKMRGLTLSQPFPSGLPEFSSATMAAAKQAAGAAAEPSPRKRARFEEPPVAASSSDDAARAEKKAAKKAAKRKQ